MTKKIMRVLEGTSYEDPPIWLMRQAGRYLPEYRTLRSSVSDLRNFFLSPQMAMEATLQPLRRYELDAAIVFSDILILPHSMGRALAYNEKTGPQMPPLQEEDLKGIPEQVDNTLLETAAETIALTKPFLPEDVAMIGFAGSPFTVACYMLDGGHVPNFPRTLSWILNQRKNFDALIQMLTTHTITLLQTQIDAGAEIVQIFDSWASIVCQQNDQKMFEEIIIKPTKTICHALKNANNDVKIIGFPRLVGDFIHSYIEHCPMDALSLDETINPLALRSALKLPYKNIPFQGNIAPKHLLQGSHTLCTSCKTLRTQIHGTPHIVNLGHGVLKSTPPEHVQELIQFFRS